MISKCLLTFEFYFITQCSTRCISFLCTTAQDALGCVTSLLLRELLFGMDYWDLDLELQRLVARLWKGEQGWICHITDITILNFEKWWKIRNSYFVLKLGTTWKYVQYIKKISSSIDIIQGSITLNSQIKSHKGHVMTLRLCHTYSLFICLNKPHTHTHLRPQSGRIG